MRWSTLGRVSCVMTLACSPRGEREPASTSKRDFDSHSKTEAEAATDTSGELDAPSLGRERSAEAKSARGDETSGEESGAAVETSADRAPRGEVATPTDPAGVLFVPGNKWTYRAYHGWHDSIHEVYPVKREVLEVNQVGSWEVALVREDIGATSMEEARSEHRMFVRRKTEMAWLEFTDDAPPKNEREMRARVDELVGAADLTRAHRELVCGFLACVGGLNMDLGYDSSIGLWPGVGLVSDVDADYSPETGDGFTRHLMLTEYDLKAPTPTLHVSDEPADLTQARVQLHELAKKKDWVALDAGLPDSFRFSLHTEHAYNEDAIESWQHQGTGADALIAATAAPCGVLDSTPVVAVCPRSEAEVHANATGRRSAQAKTSAPRAYFVREEAKWVVRAAFVGGAGDVFAGDEGSSDPATPLPAYAPPEWAD